jgi:hypothetical protein
VASALILSGSLASVEAPGSGGQDDGDEAA